MIIIVLDRIEDGLREDGDELHKVLKCLASRSLSVAKARSRLEN